MGARMLNLDERKRIVAAYDRTHDVGNIADVFGISEREVYKLAKQKRETGDLAPRTSQRGRKPKMTDTQMEELRQELLRNPGSTLGDLKEKLDLPVSESRLSRIVRQMGFHRKKKVIHASEQKRPRCGGEA